MEEFLCAINVNYFPKYFNAMMAFQIIFRFHICLQVMYLEDYEDGVNFSNLTYGPYPVIIAILLLALDSMLYLLLAVYLDQVIPGRFNF